VAFNSHKRARTIQVPEGTYTIVCRNIKCDANGMGSVKGGKVTIPAQSALIIHN
jgi:pullulanase